MNTREKWAELQEDENFNPYKNISKQEDYSRLILSGHFFDIHPELTGEWNVDKIRILGDQAEERMNIVGQNGNSGLHYVQTTTMDELGDPNQTTLNI